MGEPIVGRSHGRYFAVCTFCDRSLRGVLAVHDRVEGQWWCDNACRTDWYELQGKTPPEED